MKIIEKNITGKKSQEECEDGIVVNDDFVAVIDGSTSKTPLQVQQGTSNGRFAMQVISDYINRMLHDTTVEAFCHGITSAILDIYISRGLDIERLEKSPIERITASAIIYSRHLKQVWMIGDCHCIIDGVYHDNPKPYEAIIAEKRSAFIQNALKKGASISSFQEKDAGRASIIDELIESNKQQNKTYSVIDGFSIPAECVKVICASSEREIILASDGYPFLLPTLEESENALKQLLEEDPLCISLYKASKGLMKGQVSFDDRSYIRFSIN